MPRYIENDILPTQIKNLFLKYFKLFNLEYLIKRYAPIIDGKVENDDAQISY